MQDNTSVNYNLLTTAVAKSMESKAVAAARANLSPGTYKVDFTTRIHGTIIIAPDTEKTPTVSIPLKEVLGLFIARSGATRESSMALLSECLREALANGGGATGSLVSEIDEVFQRETTALLASLPKTPVKGAVKTKLEVELVDAV